MATQEASPQGTSQKIWRVGTLTYTFAGLVALFCWLLGGDFAWAMKDRAVGPAATLLIRTFGVSDLVYSLIIIAFPNFTNIFLMPTISYISDRHRGRFGRRIPFLAFTTPFIVVGACGLGFSPMLGRMLSTACGGPEVLSVNLASLIFFGVFWVFLDFGQTMAGALSGALINDVVPQEMLGRFFGLFRAISLLAGVLFNYFLLGMVEENFMLIFLGAGLLYGVGLCALCLKVKEGQYPPPPLPPEGQKGAALIFTPILTYFRQSFSNPYYRLVICAMVFAGMAAAPFNMFAILYAKSLNVDMGVYGKVCAFTFFCSFVLSFFLGVLVDRFHPLRTTIGALVLYLLSMAAGLFVVGDQKTYLIILFLHCLLSGVYFTVVSSLPMRLFPRSLFAQFNSALAMILAIANVLLGPLFGYILDCTGKNYRIVFLFGIIMTLTGIGLLLLVYRRFIQLGGDKAYNPPNPTAE
ncbi:MAG: MFS transporter [Lentisphaeria bacterium]|nr:MFS transporter [Lentisphaeria bacterium]